jgi:hypothetical protein
MLTFKLSRPNQAMRASAISLYDAGSLLHIKVDSERVGGMSFSDPHVTLQVFLDVISPQMLNENNLY